MLCHLSHFFSDQRLTHLCAKVTLSVLFVQVKSNLVWNTLITFDQLQNILIVIFDRDEKRKNGQENPGIL